LHHANFRGDADQALDQMRELRPCRVAVGGASPGARSTSTVSSSRTVGRVTSSW
jgi:hypothetical protein